jgi:F420H(2)-dependent quinone reductase
MTQFDQTVGLRLLSLDQRLYELTGGRWGHHLGHVGMLLLRTPGRRSGQRRTSALLYHRDRDRVVAVSSKGGNDTAPAWMLNLEANPNVEVQVATNASQLEPESLPSRSGDVSGRP